MGLLDSLKKLFKKEVSDAVNNAKYEKKTFEFDTLPTNLDELKARKEADLKDPFGVAALSVCALCVYPTDREMACTMLDFLKGPSKLSPMDKQFINDRFMDGKDYVPRSYFAGATPDNDYTPSVPYKITFRENPYSKNDAGYIKLFVTSGGADSDRYITLRNKPSTGEWFLWKHEGLLVSIRTPKSQNPWA